MAAQLVLSRLQYYTTLKKLNKTLFELNASIGRLPGYCSYVGTHTNLLVPQIDIEH